MSLFILQCWRRLTITRNHLDILKEIPFNATFVVLQHSPDKGRLYGAVFEKSKTGYPSGKKKDAVPGMTYRRETLMGFNSVSFLIVGFQY